jgi:hypothetical protein
MTGEGDVILSNLISSYHLSYLILILNPFGYSPFYPYIFIFVLRLPFLLSPFHLLYIPTYLRTILSVVYTQPTESEYLLPIIPIFYHLLTLFLS